MRDHWLTTNREMADSARVADPDTASKYTLDPEPWTWDWSALSQELT
jgi:hypothetical protein